MGTKARKTTSGSAAGALTSGRSKRFAYVTQETERLGFAGGKTARVGGRINPELLRIAQERTGVTATSELLELALANLVLEDGFADAFRATRGTVDQDLDLGI